MRYSECIKGPIEIKYLDVYMYTFLGFRPDLPRFLCLTHVLLLRLHWRKGEGAESVPTVVVTPGQPCV